MSLFANLPVTRRLDILTAAQDSLVMEMCHILLRQGIDPATFDENAYNPDNYPGDGDFMRLEKVIEGIKVTQALLDSAQ